jgi:hypothetical protein
MHEPNDNPIVVIYIKHTSIFNRENNENVNVGLLNIQRLFTYVVV